MSALVVALDGGASLGAVAELLDGMAPSERALALAVLDRARQRRLYALAAAAPPVDLAHFVPAGHAALAPVAHAGRNTLPLPRKHRFFRKVFCRPSDGGVRLWGYNDAPSRGLIGPGYFVAVPTAGRPDWEARGGVVVDYFQVPDGAVPPGWPAVVPNTKGLQRFVYHRTRDFMRRVSGHVSIGAAYREEKALDHYFTLCRVE